MTQHPVYAAAGSHQPETVETATWLYTVLAGDSLDPRVQGLLATACLRVTDQLGVANVLLVADAARHNRPTVYTPNLNAQLLNERFSR